MASRRVVSMSTNSLRNIISSSTRASAGPIIYQPSLFIKRSCPLIAVGIILMVGSLFLAEARAAVPDNKDGKYRKAQKDVVAGNFEKAERIYRELINKDPQDIDAIIGLSFLFLKQHDLERAQDEAVKA